ncbi:hypothetical protein MCA2599 [Methylococcus capsulatus str. Bath]|uniref:Uncharacterized protein n=1 Tax=Methylococcus capsulatus (strain ATCC 33009 / NCIMB 11132 / Bath) TaxID=243233 RepID=Q604E6_METCA|nr:hypothetical protein MCA2599 [Methylococcus capsulatus str. Bath]
MAVGGRSGPGKSAVDGQGHDFRTPPSPVVPIFQVGQRALEFTLQAREYLERLGRVVHHLEGHRSVQAAPTAGTERLPGHLDVAGTGAVDEHDLEVVGHRQIEHVANGDEQWVGAPAAEQYPAEVVGCGAEQACLASEFARTMEGFLHVDGVACWVPV